MQQTVDQTQPMIADKPVDIPQINTTLVESGLVYVEIYPMKVEDHGDRLTEFREEPDYYDVWIRPDDWPNNMNDVYAEWEYLSLDEASDMVDLIIEVYPQMSINWL